MNQLGNTKLFHVSEEQDIEKFIPRYSPHTNKPVVWAIFEARLSNYLLPRDCPRISYYAGNQTSAVDIKEFLGSSQQVIAIEAIWYKQAIATKLYLYELPNAVFHLFDLIAGYYVADMPVIPTHKHIVRTLQIRLSHYLQICCNRKHTIPAYFSIDAFLNILLTECPDSD